MKQKKIVAGITALLCACCIASVCLGFSILNQAWADRPRAAVPAPTYDGYIAFLSHQCRCDIVVYGEDVSFRSALNYRVIVEITEEALAPDAGIEHSFFVINDRNGRLNITDEEIEFIKSVVHENRINFFYIGHRHLSKFEALGLDGDSGPILAWPPEPSDSRGFGYVLVSTLGTEYRQLHGFWTEADDEICVDNNEVLGHILTMNFVRAIMCIRS